MKFMIFKDVPNELVEQLVGYLPFLHNGVLTVMFIEDYESMDQESKDELEPYKQSN
jgi:hypothetical protein